MCRFFVFTLANVENWSLFNMIFADCHELCLNDLQDCICGYKILDKVGVQIVRRVFKQALISDTIKKQSILLRLFRSIEKSRTVEAVYMWALITI